MTVSGISPSCFTVTPLIAADAASLRDVRLDGLRHHPEAFGASWDDEVSQTDAQFASRIERGVIFGARIKDDTRLAGIVGLHLPDATKIKHKATLWGMYVRLEARRVGVGSALLDKAISFAATSVEEINLTVGASNASALQLYRRIGFVQYGFEKRALKIDGKYYDEILLSMTLQNA